MVVVTREEEEDCEGHTLRDHRQGQKIQEVVVEATMTTMMQMSIMVLMTMVVVILWWLEYT